MDQKNGLPKETRNIKHGCIENVENKVRINFHETIFV